MKVEIKRSKSNLNQLTSPNFEIMAQNILVTGAAGCMYEPSQIHFHIGATELTITRHSGGTVLAKLLQSGQDPIKSAKLWAAVRTPEQAEVLSQWKVNVLQLDVNDTQAVKEAIVGNNSLFLSKRMTV